MKFLKTRGGITSTRYSASASVSQVNEGSSVVYTVKTVGFANGTVLYWTNGGTSNASDITGSVNSGSFTINNGQATVTLTFASDSSTEGTETILFQVRINSTSGTIVTTAPSVNIIDTSFTSYGPFEDPTGNNSTVVINSGVTLNTTEKPFPGVNSVYISGSSKGMSVSSSNNSLLLDGNFTVELFAKAGGTLGSYNGLITNVSGVAGQPGIAIARDVVWIGTNTLTSSDYVRFSTAQRLNPTSWTHYALVKSGTSVVFYENGQVKASFTSSRVPVLQSWAIGQRYTGTVTNNSWAWLGWITNIRVVKGLAVYSGVFSAPTSAVSFSGAASAAAYPSTVNVNTTFPASQCEMLFNF